MQQICGSYSDYMGSVPFLFWDEIYSSLSAHIDSEGQGLQYEISSLQIHYGFDCMWHTGRAEQ